MFPQADFCCAAEGKGKWQSCSQGLQQAQCTWVCFLKVTNYAEESSSTDQWEARTTFSAYIWVTKELWTCWQLPLQWIASFPDESSEAVIPFQTYLQYASSCLCSDALTTFPLLYDCSQLSTLFSSAALTSKNENNTKKLCNTKGEGLKFYFFQRKLVVSTFFTDALWQLQACLYYPEMCIAQSIPTGTSQWSLQNRYALISLCSAWHYPQSQPIQPSHASTLSSALCPATAQVADCHGKQRESRKLDIDMDSSCHFWKYKKNSTIWKTQTSSLIHENLS